MIWQLSDVVPNPFRNLYENPYQEWRLKRVMESITLNGFRENVLGRVRNNKLQLVFGHHRVEALRRLGYTKANFTEVEYTELQMLQGKAEENETEYLHGLEDIFESVRGAVRAFASGSITPEIAKNTARKYIRYAPGYICDATTLDLGCTINHVVGDGVPYTALSVAQALCKLESDGHDGKRPTHEVKAVLYALEMVERGFIKNDFLFYEADAATWSRDKFEWDEKYKEKNNEDSHPRVYEGLAYGPCRFECNAAHMEGAIRDVVVKTLLSRANATKATSEQTAWIAEQQAQINALREEEAEKEAARNLDLANFPQLIEEANEKEEARRAYATHAEMERQRIAAPGFRARRIALNKKARAENKAAEKERIAARLAEEEARKKAGAEPRQPFVSDLGELIKHFEKPLPSCAAEVVELWKMFRLRPTQRDAVLKASEQAISNITEFQQKLNNNGSAPR